MSETSETVVAPLNEIASDAHYIAFELDTEGSIVIPIKFKDNIYWDET